MHTNKSVNNNKKAIALKRRLKLCLDGSVPFGSTKQLTLCFYLPNIPVCLNFLNNRAVFIACNLRLLCITGKGKLSKAGV
jgi:hypothetical protein